MPVYEWQGVLFVGCLFAPENFPRLGSHKVVWVLCEAGALQDLWLEFQSASLSSSPSAAPQTPLQMESPEGLETDFNLDLTAPLIEDPVLDDITVPLQMEDLAPAADEPVAPIAKAPASNSQAGSSPEDLFALADTEEAKSPEAEPAATEESLDNGLLDLTGPMDTPAAAGASPLIALEPLSSLAKDSPSSSDGEVNLESTNESAAPASAEAKRAKPAKSEVILGGGDLSDVTRIAQNTLLSTPDEKLEGWMEQIFKDLESKFQKSMILLKKGERVRAWKWDHNFGPSSMVSSGISLIRPSPFRIVARTKKPYHGYVVPSDIADKFFGEWNDYITPEHMTIAPILVGDHVIGMLLAIGAKVSGDTKEALSLAEKEANSIAKHINSSQADKLLAA